MNFTPVPRGSGAAIVIRCERQEAYLALDAERLRLAPELLRRPDDLLFRAAGTFAPFFRASESPMAIACLRLFTLPPFPPGPDFNVPLFLRRIALSTDFPADFEYLRPDDFRPDDFRPDDFFVLAMEFLLRVREANQCMRLSVERRPIR